MPETSWDEVRIFLAVARNGQLQAAAAQLGLDRTTVARRLDALAQRLGTPLFRRTRQGIALTPAGERARLHATRMENESRALIAETAPPTAITGVVRLAVTEALAPFLVEQGLLTITDAHPGLRIELLAGSRRVDLTMGDADLALRLDPVRGAGLRVRCVDRSVIALFASREYVARHGAPKSPRQTKGHAVLIPAGELAGLPEGRWLSAQPGVTVAFASNSLPALVAAARAGRGLLALSASWGAREPELVRLFDVPKIPARAMWLVSTEETAKRPATAVVMRFLLDHLAKRATARAQTRD